MRCLVFLIPLLMMCSCSSKKEYQMNDLDRYNLKGNVTSFEIECYDEFGFSKINPGEGSSLDILVGKYYFNEEGNLMKVTYSQNLYGDNGVVYDFIYDKDGTLNEVSADVKPSNPYDVNPKIYFIKYDDKGRPKQGFMPLGGLMDYHYSGDSKYPDVRKTAQVSTRPNQSVQIQEIDSLGRIKSEIRTLNLYSGTSSQLAVYSYNDKGDIQDIRFVDDPNNLNSFRTGVFFEYSNYDDNDNWIERKVTMLNPNGRSDIKVQKRLITYKK